MTSDLDMARAGATDPSVWILLLLAGSLAVVLFVVREVSGLRNGPSVGVMLWRVAWPSVRWCWRSLVTCWWGLVDVAVTFWELLAWGVPWSRRTSRGGPQARSG